jgi:hypothetical protein
MSEDGATVPRAARALRTDWAGLAAAPGTHEPFRADSVAALPEPARRWLTHAVAPGTPRWSSVVLTMRGEIRLGRWRRFTAREVLAPARGFIWAATAHVAGIPVTGFDRHSAGAGQMRWSLFGLLPVMRVSGVDTTRSAAGRLAGEAVLWLPTAFAAARWAGGPDPDTAVATWRIGDQDDAVHVRIDSTGRLAEFWQQRWGNPDGEGFARCPFGGLAEAERTFDGVTIASQVRAGWWWGTDRQDDGEFFRATIIGAGFG